MVQLGHKNRAEPEQPTQQAPKTKATALAAQKAGYSASTSSQQLKSRLLLSLAGGEPQNHKRPSTSAESSAAKGKQAALNSSTGSQTARDAPHQPIIAYTKGDNADPIVNVVGGDDVKAALAGRSLRLTRARSKESFEGAYSVASERHPKSSGPPPIQSILKGSKMTKVAKPPAKQGAHLHKKVAFGGAGGEQVTIFFYVATEVNLPWNGPRPTGKFGSKEKTGLALRKQETALAFRMI